MLSICSESTTAIGCSGTPWTGLGASWNTLMEHSGARWGHPTPGWRCPGACGGGSIWVRYRTAARSATSHAGAGSSLWGKLQFLLICVAGSPVGYIRRWRIRAQQLQFSNK